MLSFGAALQAVESPVLVAQLAYDPSPLAIVALATLAFAAIAGIASTMLARRTAARVTEHAQREVASPAACCC